MDAVVQVQHPHSHDHAAEVQRSDAEGFVRLAGGCVPAASIVDAPRATAASIVDTPQAAAMEQDSKRRRPARPKECASSRYSSVQCVASVAV